MLEQQLRVAFFAEFPSALCAVVVAASGSAALRSEAQRVISCSTAFAARQASGYEPTMSLLHLLRDECERCIIAREAHGRPLEQFRFAAYRSVIEELVTGGVEVAVLRRGWEHLLDAHHDAPLRFVRTDSVSEPLLEIPAAVEWAYGNGRDFLAKIVGDRVRHLVID